MLSDDCKWENILTQATQIKESLRGCPGACFASNFLQNYVLLFEMHIELRKKYDEKFNREHP